MRDKGDWEPVAGCLFNQTGAYNWGRGLKFLRFYTYDLKKKLLLDLFCYLLIWNVFIKDKGLPSSNEIKNKYVSLASSPSFVIYHMTLQIT